MCRALVLTILILGCFPGAALAADIDGDGHATPADCDDFDAYVHPGQVDKPDMAFEDTNCDGIDGDIADAIFVDPVNGLDSQTGTSPQFPKQTLPSAMSAAATTGRDLYLAAGTFDGEFGLGAPIGVYGGYVPSFAARTTTEPTVINGFPAAVTVEGPGVVLQLLTLNGTAPAGQYTSYGLRVRGAGASAAIERVTVTAGNGRPGANGVEPLPPIEIPQRHGGNGNDGVCKANDLPTAPAVGTFGTGAFDPVLVVVRHGGAGGAGGRSNGAGQGPGAGGPPFGLLTGGGIPDGTGNGGDGADGLYGANGVDGQSGTLTLNGLGPIWLQPPVGDGQPGNAGVGGGGGAGGAARVQANVAIGGGQTVTMNAGGGSGGGGGGGGVPGLGGGGGESGGASIAAYLAGGRLVAIDSTLRAGNGGNGGRGRAGSQGLPGGDPGQGGKVNTSGCFGVIGFDGGAGGRGGRGGNGGAGGGGAGGPSAGVLRGGATSAYTARGSTTTQVGTAGTGGLAGRGGLPSGADAPAAGVLTAPDAGTAPGDFDGDGVNDALDGCPTIAAATGCPARPPKLVDSDGDGLPDNADACPAVAGGGNGCPDATAPPIIVIPVPTPVTPVPTPTPTAAATPAIQVTLSYAYRAQRSGTRFTRLQIRNVPRGSRVVVTCRGKGCPAGLKRKGYTKRNASGTVSLARFIKRPLRVNVTLTVVVSKPGAVGAVKVLKVRRSRAPRLTTRCLPVGAKKPSRC